MIKKKKTKTGGKKQNKQTSDKTYQEMTQIK